jgi:transposase
MYSPASLPNNVEELKRLLVGRDAMIAKLIAEIARLKRRQYGRSAEPMDGDLLAQLQLALDDLRVVAAAVEAPSVTVPADESTTPLADGSKPNVLPFRRAPRSFPEHLPREMVRHEAPHCTCPDCGIAMRPLGEDVSEVLEFVHSHFKVIQHVRPKLACGQCASVVQSPAPSRPIERGMAGPGLLAQVLIAKYADHCPLYRQVGIYRRSGIELDRATLANWVAHTARLMEPLGDAIGRYVLAGDKVHGDDTPTPVLDPGRGRTKTGRIWTYVRDDRPAGSSAPPAVRYHYSPDRKGLHPQEHLKHFKGILQADGYAGYASLYQDGRVTEAACWAHARRKFYDLYAASKAPLAAEAIARIGVLYAIEREIRGKAPDERLMVRQARSVAVLASLRAWLEATLLQVSGKSDLGGAIKYALVRWDALTLFSRDGRVEIDNNSAERSIRPVVLGRRNYMFAGSDAGGQRAAIIYSLIGTALLNAVEPYAYLRHVLERIADHPINRIDELLPWNVQLAPFEERLAA